MSESSSTLFDTRTLRVFSRVRSRRNLAWLALDYLTGIAIIAGALWLHFHWEKFGWHVAFQIPVWAVAALAIGAVQHRIALMGHEASHYLLVRHRQWNDLLAQWLCFFPLFASVVSYRARHLPHHLYPNDRERDPNLANGKAERLYEKFPMPRRAFICRFYLKLFWPPFVLANMLDLFRVVSVGSGLAPVSGKMQGGGGATWFGLAYLIVLFLILLTCRLFEWPMLIPIGGLYLAALLVWALLPESVFETKVGLSISAKWNALMRLTFHTAGFSLLLLILRWTGWDPLPAFLMLWIFPLIYVFPCLMLLREISQHANAGSDALDNSRIIHVDSFSRWAIFGYGNDHHLVHHLYPVIPHDQLAAAHAKLREASRGYRDNVEETHGTFQAATGNGESRSLLDSLAATGNRSNQTRDPKPVSG